MTAENPANPATEKAIKRIAIWILLGTGAGVILALVVGRPGFALSLLAGGGVAWFGYRAHVQLIDRAVLGRKRRFLLLKVFLRYGLIILFVYAIIRYSYFDLFGFWTGLLLPAAGVIIEGTVYIIKHIRGS